MGRRIQTVLRVHYPVGTRGLSVRGDGGPLTWDHGQTMTRVSDEVQEYHITGLSRPLQWKPLLDDNVWSRGQNYQVSPGTTTDVYPHFLTSAGRWDRHYDSFHSTLLNNDRGVWVYLPPSYDENPYRHYPVLYMHDGQNLFDPGAAFGGVTWRVAETLDNGAETLDAAQGIAEAIVIGPENTSGRVYEYTPTPDPGYPEGGGGDLYLRFLIEELKPRIDADFRTRKDVDATALCGSSLGGLITAYAGLVHPETFGRIAAVSPSTWWNNEYIVQQVHMRGAQLPRPSHVYVDSGDSGPSNDDVTETRSLAQEYRNAGYQDGVNFLYVVQMGGMHNETYWAQRLPAALHFLLAGL